MTFNPYFQFNFNSAFTCGAFIGNCLRESITAGKTEVSESAVSTSSVNFNLFSNNWFSAPIMPVNMFDVSIFPQAWNSMPIVQQNWFGISFGNIGENFSAGWNNFSSMLVQPFNFDFNFTNIGGTQKVGNVKYAKIEDYNAAKGEKLAKLAYENTAKMFDSSWKCTGSKNRDAVINHVCARYVAIAVSEAGLGDCRVSSAYQMTNKLRNNPNFKELSVSGTDWKHLPPGAVCVYGTNSGYSKEHGHVLIITENGNAAEHYSSNLKKPDYIFIPV